MLLFISFRPSFLSGHPVVSIHLMLLFICVVLISVFTFLRFQYISCYSLSKYSFISFSRSLRFNTSHVTLYQMLVGCFLVNVFRFNTSHVTLYLSAMLKAITPHLRFNTSHVTLYPSFYRLFFF